MLVHEQHRRQGIAKALITTCLDYLHARNIRCIKLDATPAGKLVYSQLGFRDEWSFHRWHRESDNTHQQGNLPAPGARDKWNLELDSSAFGVQRADWLNRLAAHSHLLRYREACGMIREGYLASYLGPIIASGPSSAERIVTDLLACTRRPTFWDIPQPNHHAVTLAQAHGFQPVRNLTRMWTGLELIPCDIRLQYAISDPGTG